LFLVRGDEGQPIREGERTSSPPVHEACAYEAARSGPHLLKGWTAALVKYTPAWGVAGIVHDPRTLEPIPGPVGPDGKPQLEYVAYDDLRIRWTCAVREVVQLLGCEVVALNDLAPPTAKQTSTSV
jgi:hypothetical protein